MEQSPSW